VEPESLDFPIVSAVDYTDFVFAGSVVSAITLVVSLAVFCGVSALIRHPREGRRDVVAKAVVAAFTAAAVVFCGAVFVMLPSDFMAREEARVADEQMSWLEDNYSWLASPDELQLHLDSQEPFTKSLGDKHGLFPFTFRFVRSQGDEKVLLMFGPEGQSERASKPAMQNAEREMIVARQDSLLADLHADRITFQAFYVASFEWLPRTL